MQLHWHRQFNYTHSLVMYCISAGAAGHHWFWQGIIGFGRAILPDTPLIKRG